MLEKHDINILKLYHWLVKPIKLELKFMILYPTDYSLCA